MKGKAGAAGTKVKAHQPAAAGAAAAQAAAVPPGNDVASQAAAAQVEEMGAQQPGTFDRKAFIAAVQKAIDAAAPKNLEEADDFKESGKAAQVKGEVGGLVKGGKKDAEKDIKGATDAPPDTSKARPKPVAPLTPEEPGAAPPSVGAAAAMPGPRPPEDTDLSAGPAEVDEEMEREGVTEEQLANSNEPDFTSALDARQTAKEHSASAPAEYRAQEQEVLAKGREEAEAVEGAGLAGMQGSKVAALAKVAGAKGETKSQDEAKRAKVAADIQAIYDKTKADVTGILTGLDGKVETAFASGEESARKQFEDYVGEKMDAYKDDRYSGWLGGARWLKDKLFGMPGEVNVFYSQGRAGYLTAMDAVIGQVADIVGGELNAARMRIAQGRAEVRDYVTQLPADLQKVGKEAEEKLDEQFDQLSSDVDNKQDALVDQLAQKYVQSRDALDSRIEEMKAANRGLVDKALDAVVGVVKTILKLKDMLLNVLAKAADVIGDIISDPIGFLGNLIGGIKEGLSQFVGNIATHLKEGLMGWLFGALGDAGIKMPKTFDLAGIFELVMDVLGLTYRSIRGRVAKIVGEPVVEKMEQTVDVFKMLVTDGPAALWNWVKDKVGDFQEMVFGGLKDFIIERVIKGGITWLLSLLNPAAAFIKACKAIYDIVMFIVERGSQIMEFVNSVLDSIGAIARGQLSVAAEKVEGALARALPLAIGFLASLLGLGGISDKIRETIDKVRKPIEKVVDTVVMGAVKGFKKTFGGAIGWVKGKYEKGKQFVTEKATAAKDWAVGKAEGASGWVKGKLGWSGASEGFDMEGEPHTLSLVPGPKARIEMASERGALLLKLDREAARAESPEQQATAAALRTSAESIEERCTAALAAPDVDTPEGRARLDALDEELAQLGVAIRAYGRRWNRRDLGVELTGEEDDTEMVAQAVASRAEAMALIAAHRPAGERETKTYAVGGNVVRLSGWGSTEAPVAGAPEEQQRWQEHHHGVWEVSGRISQGIWRGTETLTGRRTGEVRVRNLIEGPEPEDLDAAFARWQLGNENEAPDADAEGEADVILPVEGGRSLNATQQMNQLLEQGVTRTTVRREGQMWTREIRVAQTPAAGIAGAHTPREDMNDMGVPGQVSVAHAEQQVHRVAGDTPIGVSKDMCPVCQSFFRSEATRLGRTLVVADPSAVRLFRPNGTVDVR